MVDNMTNMRPPCFQETFGLFSPRVVCVNSAENQYTVALAEQHPDFQLTQAFIEFAVEQLNSLLRITEVPSYPTRTFYTLKHESQRNRYFKDLKHIFFEKAHELEALLRPTAAKSVSAAQA